MEQKIFEKNFKIFSDDDKLISEVKLNNKIKIERRENKPKSVHGQNIDIIISF